MMMNPIFESSARRRMRMTRTPVVVWAYLITMLALAVFQLTDFFGRGVTVAAMRKGVEGYIWMTAMQFFLIIIVAPALSAGSISGERERQTFDLLLVTGVGTRSIVFGKLLEHFAFLLLLILSSAPVMALALITGGVTLADVAATLTYLSVIALGALYVGMVASVMFRRTLIAVIMAYLMILVIGAGTWVLAKRGPIAAAYTSDSLAALANMSTRQVLATLPAIIFLNPAVGLVMLLAGQTGILHRTMESTMRLYHIYSASKVIGFTPVAYAALCGMLLAIMLTALLACIMLHIQTGSKWRRGR